MDSTVFGLFAVTFFFTICAATQAFRYRKLRKDLTKKIEELGNSRPTHDCEIDDNKGKPDGERRAA